MILFAVALVCWLVLTLPVAVLMGKCISRGLAPAPADAAAVTVPGQRSPRESAGVLVPAHAVDA